MLLTEYNPKKYRQLFIEEAQEIGHKQGLEEGRLEGQQLGRLEGFSECESRLNKLYTWLLKANRLDDLQRAMEDDKYRQQLFEEYDTIFTS